MNNRDQELLGLLGGGLSAAAVHYNRTQDNLDRRIDRVDDRSRDALDLINRWLNNGATARLLLAAVQDIIAGVAMSSPAPQAPAVVPATTVVTRPDISGFQSATGNNWPPIVGTYDNDNRILTVGELTKFALALTYEEVRTALLALVQNTPPSLGSKAQIFNVFNSLISSVAGRSGTLQQYRNAWDNLFSGIATAQSSDPHQDPTKIPQASGLGGNVSSVVPLANSTDQVARFRITADGTGISSGPNPVFTVTYATPYPVAPIVLCQQFPAMLWVTGLGNSTTSYTVVLQAGAISANATLDMKLLSLPGVQL